MRAELKEKKYFFSVTNSVYVMSSTQQYGPQIATSIAAEKVIFFLTFYSIVNFSCIFINIFAVTLKIKRKIHPKQMPLF